MLNKIAIAIPITSSLDLTLEIISQSFVNVHNIAILVVMVTHKEVMLRICIAMPIIALIDNYMQVGQGNMYSHHLLIDLLTD